MATSGKIASQVITARTCTDGGDVGAEGSAGAVGAADADGSTAVGAGVVAAMVAPQVNSN
jgi:hypothetical protein